MLNWNIFADVCTAHWKDKNCIKMEYSVTLIHFKQHFIAKMIVSSNKPEADFSVFHHKSLHHHQYDLEYIQP